MEPRLLNILVCPLCKGDLKYDILRSEMICYKDRILFPIHDDIPILLESAAQSLDNNNSNFDFDQK